jgi:hypothetical protein
MPLRYQKAAISENAGKLAQTPKYQKNFRKYQRTVRTAGRQADILTNVKP